MRVQCHSLVRLAKKKKKKNSFWHSQAFMQYIYLLFLEIVLSFLFLLLCVLLFSFSLCGLLFAVQALKVIFLFLLSPFYFLSLSPPDIAQQDSNISNRKVFLLSFPFSLSLSPNIYCFLCCCQLLLMLIDLCIYMRLILKLPIYFFNLFFIHFSLLLSYFSLLAFSI